MGIINKIKLWWRSKTPTEKILTVLGGITATASTIGAVYAVKTYTEMEDRLSVEVKLYPKGKDDPNPKKLLPHTEDDEPEPPVEKIPANVTTEKWDVWNPDWELKYHSDDGHECTRLNDALECFKDDELLCEPAAIDELEARVEDLARQFSYLNGMEDEFRERFPDLKDHAVDIYENVEATKGE